MYYGATLSTWESTNYYRLDQIQRRHWNMLAEQVRMDNEIVEAIIEEIVIAADGIAEIMYRKLPVDFPSGLAESILDGMLRQCKKLRA